MSGKVAGKRRKGRNVEKITIALFSATDGSWQASVSCSMRFVNYVRHKGLPPHGLRASPLMASHASMSGKMAAMRR
eukprot:2111517-Amphidinium_carterae.1